MFNPREYAFNIQTTANAIFKRDFCYGLGLVLDLDYIEKNPFIAMSFALGNFYNKADFHGQELIDDFIEKYYWLQGKSIVEIGEDKIENIVNDFNYIIKVI